MKSCPSRAKNNSVLVRRGRRLSRRHQFRIASASHRGDETGDGRIREISEPASKQGTQPELCDLGTAFGTRLPKVPIWIAIDDRFTKPARANFTTTTITPDRLPTSGSKVAEAGHRNRSVRKLHTLNLPLHDIGSSVGRRMPRTPS